MFRNVRDHLETSYFVTFYNNTICVGHAWFGWCFVTCFSKKSIFSGDCDFNHRHLGLAYGRRDPAFWCVRYLVGNSYFRPAQSSKPFDTSAHWFEPVGNWENILYAEFASSCDLHLHGGGKCTRRDFLIY